MVEYDYVLRNIKVVEKDIEIDFKKFYGFLSKLLADHGYYVMQEEYINQLKDNKSSKSIKLIPYKKIDDYTIFNIEIRLKLLDAEEVEGETAMLYQGDLFLKFKCYITKDYENKWEHNAFLKFLRTIYDYIFLGPIFNKYEKQIKEETLDVVEKTKLYLGGKT